MNHGRIVNYYNNLQYNLKVADCQISHPIFRHKFSLVAPVFHQSSMA